MLRWPHAWACVVVRKSVPIGASRTGPQSELRADQRLQCAPSFRAARPRQGGGVGGWAGRAAQRDHNLSAALGDPADLPGQAPAPANAADAARDLSARPLYLPVLWPAGARSDARPRLSAPPRWAAYLGEPGRRLQDVQPPQGRTYAHRGADEAGQPALSTAGEHVPRLLS